MVLPYNAQDLLCIRMAKHMTMLASTKRGLHEFVDVRDRRPFPLSAQFFWQRLRAATFSPVDRRLGGGNCFNRRFYALFYDENEPGSGLRRRAIRPLPTLMARSSVYHRATECNRTISISSLSLFLGRHSHSTTTYLTDFLRISHSPTSQISSVF